MTVKKNTTANVISPSDSGEKWIEPYDKLVDISGRLSYFGCSNVRLSSQRDAEHRFKSLGLGIELGVVSLFHFDLPYAGSCKLFWNGHHTNKYSPFKSITEIQFVLLSDLPEQSERWVIEGLIRSIFGTQLNLDKDWRENLEKPALSIHSLVPVLLAGTQYPIKDELKFV